MKKQNVIRTLLLVSLSVGMLKPVVLCGTSSGKSLKRKSKNEYFVQKKVSYKQLEALINMLYAIIQERKSHWSNAQTVTSILSCLIDECREMEESLQNRDYKKAEEEFGDILGMTLQLGLIAERDRLFDINKSAENQINKTHRRAPYIFDAELAKQVSNLTEAIEIWYTTKRKEREG
ncbi:MAG: MazG nucleotide pyrophosphohydrolase domain-containing protein [Victivallaceae bacterium]